ncbi:MAG: 4-hydroxy-tetrahydrodipicolinate reductase [Muribaculaceae bacterium]|nr:4-hydroxy-tetrahydrodipicolinate reductase [Muribaculaceae bacterium]
MNIAIIGYGRMGHMVEQVAAGRGHHIVAVIDAANSADMDGEVFRSADVAIEFSVPATAESNCRRALACGVPVVSGTTGWSAELEQLRADLSHESPALMWSSNYSLGVNLFFIINRYVSRLMGGFAQYVPVVNEVHHIHKLDHPSGTAISLAQDVVNRVDGLSCWSEEPAGADALVVNHARIAETPGTHTVRWSSDVDYIAIEHCAHSRQGFALGAVMAAEWIRGRHGFYTMDNMMRDIVPASLIELTETI